jgi:hypothetical protein
MASRYCLGFLHIDSFVWCAGAATALLMAKLRNAAVHGTDSARIKNIHDTAQSFPIQMRMQKNDFPARSSAGTEQLRFNGGKLIVQMFIVSLEPLQWPPIRSATRSTA